MFLVFQFDDFYPDGGINDLVKTFESMPTRYTLSKICRDSYGCLQVYNTETGENRNYIPIDPNDYLGDEQKLKDMLELLENKELTGGLSNYVYDDYIIVRSDYD